jgi:hypothetical protein
MTIGVRGSDQYWYISDLKSLLSPVFSGSNCLYPVPFLQGFYSEQISVPFMHHTLTLYLAYPFGFLLGEFNGFLTYNIVMALVSSSLISCAIGRYTNKKIATLAYGFILFNPLIFWQTANLLQEITIFAFVAVVMAFGLSSIENSNLAPISRRSWQAISIIGILVHPIFIFLSIHAVLYDIYFRRRRSVFNVIVTFIVMISILKIKYVLFPDSFPPSLMDLASCHQPNRSNMAYFFYFDHFQPTLHWITYKISSFWKALFRLTPINTNTILIPAGIISFVGLYYQRLKWWKFIATMFVFLILPWGAMCLIHQFQTRYILILAPPLLVGVWCFIHNWATNNKNNNITNKLVVIIGSICICVLIIFDVLFIGNILKSSTLKESHYCNSIKTVFKDISNKDRIIFTSGDETIGKSLMFSYADQRLL